MGEQQQQHHQQQQQVEVGQGLVGLDLLSKSAELKVVRKRISKLYADLDVSLHIQSIWPDAFKYGKCRSTMSGNLTKISDMKVVFKNDQEEKVFNLVDLPEPIKHKKFNEIYTKAEGSQRGFVASQINKLLLNPVPRGSSIEKFEEVLSNEV